MKDNYTYKKTFEGVLSKAACIEKGYNTVSFADDSLMCPGGIDKCETRLDGKVIALDVITKIGEDRFKVEIYKVTEKK